MSVVAGALSTDGQVKLKEWQSQMTPCCEGRVNDTTTLVLFCRISLGSESRIYEFPSGKFCLQEVGSRNYKWETGASRQHPELKEHGSCV